MPVCVRLGEHGKSVGVLDSAYTHKGFDMLRRDEPHSQAKVLETAGPIVGGITGLHDHHVTLLLRDKGQKASAAKTSILLGNTLAQHTDLKKRTLPNR